MFFKIKKYFKENNLSLVLFAFFFLLPFGRLSTCIVIILSVLGCVQLYKDMRSGTNYNLMLRPILKCAYCIILPSLLSMFVTISPDRTLRFIVMSLGMMPAGYYIAASILNGDKIDPFVKGLFLIVLFWAGTMGWQYFVPSSIFGSDISHLQGIHTKEAGGSLMLGVITPTILAFFIGFLYKRHSIHWLLIVTLLLTVMTLMSGTRSGWIAMVFVVITVALVDIYKNEMPILKKLCIYLSFGLAFTVICYQVLELPGTKSRFNLTKLIFEHPTAQMFEFSSSGRLSIWQDAIKIFYEHPFLGIGANSFRIEHQKVMVAKKDNNNNVSTSDIKGASHTHQIMLEVAVGTGCIGLIGLYFLYNILWQFTLEAIRMDAFFAMGGFIGIWAGFLPFNTHNNFYGSWMMGWLWIWMGLSLGLLEKHKQEVKKINLF